MKQLDAEILRWLTTENETSAIDSSIIEKDYYIVQLVKLLQKQTFTHNDLSFELIFGGGTSLSKCFNLITRLSEDLDFKVVFNTQYLSKSSAKEIRSQVKKQINACIQNSDLLQIAGECLARDENRSLKWKIIYPLLNPPIDGMRDYISLDVQFVEGLDYATLNRPMGSMFTTVAGQPAEVTGLKCIDPIETATDKIAAISWRFLNRMNNESTYETQTIRHVYDLYYLSHLIHELELQQKLVFRDHVQRKSDADARIRLKEETFGTISWKEGLEQTVALLTKDERFKQEYERFVIEYQIDSNEYIPYLEIITTFRQLTDLLKNL